MSVGAQAFACARPMCVHACMCSPKLMSGIIFHHFSACFTEAACVKPGRASQFALGSFSVSSQATVTSGPPHPLSICKISGDLNASLHGPHACVASTLALEQAFENTHTLMFD